MKNKKATQILLDASANLLYDIEWGILDVISGEKTIEDLKALVEKGHANLAPLLDDTGMKITEQVATKACKRC